MPRSAGHRPGRTAMAAGRRESWTRGPAGGREAFSASARRPSAGRPRGPCQRTALPPGGRLLGARGAWLPWAPGAQQCSRGGAQRQPRRAPSQPPRGARSPGAGRRAPQNPDWSSGAGRWRGGAGGRKEGPGRPAGARAGHPQHRGSLWAMPEAPPGRGWGGGRGGLPPPLAVSRDRDLSLKPEVDWFFGSGLSRTRQSTHRWPGRGPGLRRPRLGASLRRAALGWGAPGRFRCSTFSPHPTPSLQPVLGGRLRAAVRCQTSGLDRGLRESYGAPACAQRCPGSRRRTGQIRSHPQSQTRSLPDSSGTQNRVAQGFPNPRRSSHKQTTLGRSATCKARDVCAPSAHGPRDVGVKELAGF